MTTSEQINELATAMCAAQGAMRPAVKDSTNPAFRSKYADLTAVWEACRQPLASNKLTVWQDVTFGEGGVSVTTRILHVSGQWVEFGPLTVPLTKTDAQGVGSATSYGRRYALSAALGIVADDDDGNAAVGKPDTNGKGAEASRPRSALPAGYQAWIDDMASCADEGTEKLQTAWKASKPEYRKHLMDTNNAMWDGLKTRAAKVKGAA